MMIERKHHTLGIILKCIFHCEFSQLFLSKVGGPCFKTCLFIIIHALWQICYLFFDNTNIFSTKIP